MANEIAVAAQSGQTLYCVLRNSAGQPYNTGTPAFETYTSARWASYAISLAEQGGSGFYVGSVPAGVSASGRYTVQAKQRAGALAAPSDATVALGVLLWGGSSEVDVLANADKTGYQATATVGGYASGQDPASLLLLSAANKLATDSGGRVSVAGYAAGQDPASLVLSTPQNKLLTNASGQVQHDMTQAVPTSNTAQTVGDALNAARAQGFGKWVLAGTQLQLFAADGTTVVRTFTLDSASAPTQRA